MHGPENAPTPEEEKEEEEKLIAEKLQNEFETIYESEFDIIGNFGKKLREKYNDCDNYLYYHIIAGSGMENIDPKAKKPEKLDFPGDDSVEIFIDNLYQKHVKGVPENNEQ